MGGRRKDILDLLRRAAAQGYVVIDPGRGKPLKIMCRCPMLHMSRVHQTPSGMTYANRKLNEMRKWACWQEDAR